MLRAQISSPAEGKLPVFVFPTTLTFCSDDQNSHKQVLTLYNPYDFSLRFKVLCTAPKKYSVVESEGTVKARCCVDIVVRHKEIGINSEGIRDKFRFHVTEHGQKNVIGKKDVNSMLIPTKDKAPSVDEKFESLPIVQDHHHQDSQHSIRSLRPCGGSTASPVGPSWVVLVAAVICIAALMLPTLGDATTSSLPTYLFLSPNQKLIAAYILGLVTMVVLRS